MTTLGAEDVWGGVVVVPEGERAFAARRGERAETQASLRSRLRQSLAPDLELADPVTIRLALSRSAADVVDGDPWLGPLAERGGRAWLLFVDALDDAFTVLAGRRDALFAVGRGADSVAARARLLAQAAEAFDDRLAKAGLLDPRREAEVLAGHVARADPRDVAAALSATEVRARGIVQWAADDLALFRALDASLSRLGGRALVLLPVFDRPLDAARARDPLETIGDAVASALDDAPPMTPLAPVLGDLSLDGPPPAATTARVLIRQATSGVGQARAIAHAVHAALLDGTPPNEVVVALVSDDEATVGLLQHAFREAEIPLADVRPRRPHRSNLVAFADFVLGVAAAGSPRLDVATILRSSYVDSVRVSGDSDRAVAARRLCDTARRLEETKAALGPDVAAGQRLAATVLTATTASGREAPELVRVARQVGELLERVAGGKSRRDHVRSARAVWGALGLGVDSARAPATTASANRPAGALLELAARARDREAWARLEATLADYARASVRLGVAEEEASVETFRHELAWAYARADAPASPSPFAVSLMRFADLSPDGAKVVAFADADDSTWPRGWARADLVPDALLERLSRATDPRARPLALAGGSAVLAHLAVGVSAARDVLFAYATRDVDGAVRAPARVVTWLSALATSSSWGDAVLTAQPMSAHERTLAELALSPERAAELLPDVARRARLEKRRDDAFGVALDEGHPLVATLPVGDAFRSTLTEETGGGGRPLSATAIDRLATCGFRGFVTEVLRPRRIEEAPEVADAREEGKLTHAALERAFRATAELWPVRPRDRETILRAGMAAAEEALAVASTPGEMRRVVVQKARAAVRGVLEWSIADLEWDFAHAEQAFGEGEVWGELVLGEGRERVRIRGRIDRVDVAHDGSKVRVLDYKTRERAAKEHTAALGSLTFQLPLYARVAREALGRAAGNGIYVATERLRAGAASKTQVEKWRAAHEAEDGAPLFERVVVRLVESLRRGQVFVQPASAASCLSCDLEGVCRKPRFAASGPLVDAEEDA